MSEKVKFTKEQADAIDWLLETGDWNVDEIIIAHAQNNNGWDEGASALINMSRTRLVKGLRVGYEIEQPECKPGDYILDVFGRIWAIKRIADDGTYFGIHNDDDIRVMKKQIKKILTPDEIKAEKERQLWKKIDREYGKLKWDDVLVLNDGTVFRVLSDRCEQRAISYIKQGAVVKFYPAESFISFEEGDSDD